MKEDINQYDSRNKMHGLRMEHYITGQLMTRSRYFHGKKVGLRVCYNADGSIWKKQYYL